MLRNTMDLHYAYANNVFLKHFTQYKIYDMLIEQDAEDKRSNAIYDRTARKNK